VSKPGNTMALGFGPRSIKFSRDWITRPVFAVLLGGAVIFAIYAGRPYLEFVVAVAVLLAAREWHRMVGKGRFLVELTATTSTIWLAFGAFFLWPATIFPWAILLIGTYVVLGIGLVRHGNPIWHAAGVLYLGVPALSIIALRDFAPHGAWVLVALFLIVWATDTGALFCGNLIGGPRLAPVLSPNKTWSGTIGGIVAAGIVLAIFIALMGGHSLAAAGFGAAMGVVAHAGDLFESWAKRCFHLKDSGSMIPGHGGVLDRIDSTLAAVVALAVVVLVFGFDPLFGAFP
jgi:phosphatidate cytidylyltransferase